MGPLLFQTLGWVAGIFAVIGCVAAVVLLAICIPFGKENHN